MHESPQAGTERTPNLRFEGRSVETASSGMLIIKAVLPIGPPVNPAPIHYGRSIAAAVLTIALICGVVFFRFLPPRHAASTSTSTVAALAPVVVAPPEALTQPVAPRIQPVTQTPPDAAPAPAVQSLTRPARNVQVRPAVQSHDQPAVQTRAQSAVQSHAQSGGQPQVQPTGQAQARLPVSQQPFSTSVHGTKAASGSAEHDRGKPKPVTAPVVRGAQPAPAAIRPAAAPAAAVVRAMPPAVPAISVLSINSVQRINKSGVANKLQSTAHADVITRSRQSIAKQSATLAVAEPRRADENETGHRVSQAITGQISSVDENSGEHARCSALTQRNGGNCVLKASPTE